MPAQYNPDLPITEGNSPVAVLDHYHQLLENAESLGLGTRLMSPEEEHIWGECQAGRKFACAIIDRLRRSDQVQRVTALMNEIADHKAAPIRKIQLSAIERTLNSGDLPKTPMVDVVRCVVYRMKLVVDVAMRSTNGREVKSIASNVGSETLHGTATAKTESFIEANKGPIHFDLGVFVKAMTYIQAFECANEH